MQLVWLKRDLRLADHRPLADAVVSGEDLLVLYVYEPEILSSDEHDPAHLAFVNQSLAELDEALQARGGRITYRVGTMPDVLAKIREDFPFTTLRSHRETGNAKTFARDRRVTAWTRAHGVRWIEVAQDGVRRPHGNRDGWAAAWNRFMKPPPIDAPSRVPCSNRIPSENLRRAADLGLAATTRALQAAGERAGHERVASFLAERGERYREEMSSPVTAFTSCSRISPHLAYGNVTMRQLHHALEVRRAALRAARAEGVDVGSHWLQSLQSFGARLRWHCHFMQKLEDQPSLEFRNMSRAFDGLREDDFDDDRFQAWCMGRTGYPLVDACMRALQHDGWINFRMRAMLMSFASYHLWLHWRPTSTVLARLFVDFEPGIHYTQAQMQSGVSGINAIRVYSPIKQARDQDPAGNFIRRFVPELEGVPAEHIHQPQLMSNDERRRYGGSDYPGPIVEHDAARKAALQKIYAVKRTPEAKAEAERVYERHGSRKRPRRRRSVRSRSSSTIR